MRTWAGLARGVVAGAIVASGWGCAAGGQVKDSLPVAEAPAEAPTEAPVEVAPAAEPVARAAAPAFDLGFDILPPDPPAKAFKANTAGLKRHEAGDWAASKALFAEAVGVAAEYDLARYNLACAHARLGELDAAAAELRTVLERDLPRFRRRWDEDQDLVALRRSPQGEALRLHLEALEQAWVAAVRGGVPAVLVREQLHAVTGTRAVGQVRPGVWNHGLRRFIPTMDELEDSFSALTDPVHGQAITLIATPDFNDGAKLVTASVAVAPLDPPGVPPRITRLGDEALDAVELHAIAQGARVRTNGVRTAWRELRAGGLVRSPTQDGPDRPVLKVNADGTLLFQPPPSGFSVKGAKLFAPGAAVGIALQRRHGVSPLHSVLTTGDGAVAIVTSMRAKCHDGESVLRHVIDRVDLRARSAEPLSDDKGQGAAALGPDGALYLQIGDTVHRYATVTATSHEKLPDGVRLVAPMGEPTCAD